MSWFKKEENVHFERNHEGRVIGGYRNGEAFKVDPNRKPEPKWKSSGQLEQEYYAKQPKIKKQSPPSRVTNFFNPLNRIDVVPVPYKLNRKHPQHKPYYPSKTNSNPFHSMFDTGISNAPRMKKPKSKPKSKKRTKKKDNLLSFDMLGNNWGL